MSKVHLLIGTKKGAFILDSDASRERWDLRGPFCDMWPLSHVSYDASRGAILAAGGNAWFGHAIWKSTDGGGTWTHSSQGLEFAEGKDPVSEAWAVAAACDGTLFAGVAPGGLFKSTDGGETWSELEGFTNAPYREHWNPGGAGLITHCIVTHPTDPKRLYVAISAGGVYASDDGGETWEARNSGVQVSFVPEGQSNYPPAGQCTHRLMVAPGDWETLVQRNHEMVWRSTNGGRSWENVNAGLPTEFGFAAAAHPRDSKTYYVLPLTDPFNGRFVPDGKVAVYRTRDFGDSWECLRSGLPQENAYHAAFRAAMATDRLDPAGVYFGTVSGDLFMSVDEGESWRRLPMTLPAITSVEAVVL